MKQACIHVTDENLKKEAQLLAKLNDESLSQMIWRLVSNELDQNHKRLAEFKKLLGAGNA